MNNLVWEHYNKELPLLYKGRVYKHSQQEGITNSYRFTVSKKIDVLNLLDFYFSKNPSNSVKQRRLNLIKTYYFLIEKKANKSPKGSLDYKKWLDFQKKWND